MCAESSVDRDERYCKYARIQEQDREGTPTPHTHGKCTDRSRQTATSTYVPRTR